MTNSEIKHQINNLVKPGIANTELILREYQFTADNELDYTTSFSTIGNKTITELPSNTAAISLYMFVYDVAGSVAYMQLKRKVTDSNVYLIYSSTASVDYARKVGIFWIPTNGNQIYIAGISGTVFECLILGYKVKV